MRPAISGRWSTGSGSSVLETVLSVHVTFDISFRLKKIPRATLRGSKSHPQVLFDPLQDS